QLFHHRRVPGEPRRIELLHLLLKVINLLLRRPIALRRLAQLAQLTQALLNHPLRVRRIPANLRRRRAPRRVIRLPARIDVQIGCGTASTAPQLAIRVAPVQLPASRSKPAALPSSLRNLIALTLLSALALLLSASPTLAILPSLLPLTPLPLPLLTLLAL